MSDYDVSGEDPKLVSYRLRKLEEAVQDLVRTNRDLHQTYVRRDNYDLKINLVEARINGIDERIDKVSRALMTVITSVVGTIVAAIALYFIFGATGV